jgi:hypothetical protein
MKPLEFGRSKPFEIDELLSLRRALPLQRKSEVHVLKEALHQLRWRDRVPVKDWIEQNVYLTKRFADRPGFIDLSLTPYTIEPLETLDMGEVRETTFCTGSQLAKSITLTAGLAYVGCNEEGQAIYTLPTADAASWHVNNRWKPIGLASPKIMEQGFFDRDNFKVSEQRGKNMTISWVGSNSPSQGAMRSAPYLFLDEVDKMGESTDKEPGFFHLIKERCKSFPLHKIFKASTPTLNNRGIWIEFKDGDMRYYLLSSPFAPENGQFKFVFEGIKWDPDARNKNTGDWDKGAVRSSAYYECPHTGNEIKDIMKQGMLRNGVWIPTRPNAEKRHRSYQLSSIYSPWLTFGDIAVKFLESKGQPSGLHNFYNSWLGLPFIKTKKANTTEDIKRIQENSPEYSLGTIPLTSRGRPDVMLMTIDVQQMCFYFVIRAWWAAKGGKPATSALIKYGRIETWNQAKEHYYTPYTYEGEEVHCAAGLVDAGYASKKTGGVYDFCLAEYNEFFPSFGRSASQGFVKPVDRRVIVYKGKELEVTFYNDSIWTEELYSNVIPGQSDTEFWLPKDVDFEYIKQITDTKLVEIPVTDGETRNDFEDTGNNHLGDCEKLQLVLFHRIEPLLG